MLLISELTDEIIKLSKLTDKRVYAGKRQSNECTISIFTQDNAFQYYHSHDFLHHTSEVWYIAMFFARN